MKDSSINNKAFKAGTWYTIGNILLKGCIFFSLPIFIRLLTTIEFGEYNTYMAYEGIISAILGMGLYGTVKNAKLDFKKNFDEYLSTIIIFSLIILLIILLIINIFFPFFYSIFKFNQLIVNVMFLQGYSNFLLYFYGVKLNIEFKYKSYILLIAINTIGNIFLSILLIKYVFINNGTLGRIYGSALSVILVAIVICFLILKESYSFKFKYCKYGLVIGLPLVPHVISQSILSQFDRIMINDMIDPSKAGIYSYIYTLCTILSVIYISVDNAWSSWIFIKLSEGKEEEIKKKGNNYIFIFSLLTLAFICIMPEIVKIIANEEYWEGIILLLPLSLANFFTFLYFLPVGIEYYYKKTKYISIGTIVTAIINIFLNVLFIRKMGYFGAAYSTMISYFLLFLFHWKITKKYSFSKIYDIAFIFKMIFLLFLVGIVFFMIRNLVLYIFIRYIILLLIIIYLIRENKNIILLFLNKKRGDKL